VLAVGDLVLAGGNELHIPFDISLHRLRANRSEQVMRIWEGLDSD
jgi:hypothetical protein